jgi:hypothetical protein
VHVVSLAQITTDKPVIPKISAVTFRPASFHFGFRDFDGFDHGHIADEPHSLWKTPCLDHRERAGMGSGEQPSLTNSVPRLEKKNEKDLGERN